MPKKWKNPIEVDAEKKTTTQTGKQPKKVVEVKGFEKAKKKLVVKDTVKLEHLLIEEVDILSIHPNTYNPNRQSDHDFELLCRSIEEDGFTQPILINKKEMEIIDGEHRWRALKALGRKTAPVVFTEMTRQQQLVATLRHNRARGNENINMAADVLRDLNQQGALEHATDSLMLDPIDIKVMLDDIPQTELQLREPGLQMSIEETESLIQQEKDAISAKQQEERVMNMKDRDRYTFQFEYPWTEGWLIERIALGRNRNENKADNLVRLCKKWGKKAKTMGEFKTVTEVSIEPK
jgi:ParB/RepB/Spo0J family partition protein